MRRAKIISMLSGSLQSPTPETQSASETESTIESIPKIISHGTTDKVTEIARKQLLSSIPEGNVESEGQDREPAGVEDEMDMLDKWDPMAEDFYSNENTLTLDPDKDPECMITGKMTDDHIMVGKYRVCKFFLKHGTCADGKYCDLLHIHPSARDKIHEMQRESEMNTSRTRMVSSYLSPVDLVPDEHSLLLVSVTMMTSPTRFYFVAPYEQMNFAMYSQNDIAFYVGRVQHASSIKTKLQRCHEQLACLFDHNYRIDNSKNVLCIGQMVACKLEDGRFCRATVLNNRDRDDFEVYYDLFLIDVGIEFRLKRDSIYEIRANCLSEPPMAILGRLELKPANDELSWSQGAMSLFEEFVTKSKYLLCKVVDYRAEEDLFTVDLLDIDDRTSITALLLQHNYAERMTL